MTEKEIVISEICREFNVSFTKLMSRSRQEGVVVARHTCMYVLHKKLGLGVSAVGKVLNRDHSTVMYAIDSVTFQMDNSRSYKKMVEMMLLQKLYVPANNFCNRKLCMSVVFHPVNQ